jgi:multicomponent Na+:H+ antiporter subunit C
VSVVLAVVIGGLYAAGTWLILQRALTRIVIGLVLLGHGSVLLLLFGAGAPGDAPFVGDPGSPADPLPQALALTAIVITFAVVVLLLALAYRSWELSRDDEVEDDVEDARIARLRRRAERVEAEQAELERELDER